MIALIGNCPSSGSTLLADLLDSTQFSACGEELEFFCNKKIYDYEKYKKNINTVSGTYQICVTGIYPKFQKLGNYGFSLPDFSNLIKNSDSLVDFTNSFTKRFLEHREKNSSGIVFEKTPQNLNCIGEFLEAFPTSHFIFIVRNPLYIYPSLLKRNRGNYVALVNWLVDVAKYFQYKDHDRVVAIKYEDLVERPYEIVVELMQRVAGIKEISENELEESYKNNQFRRENAKKISTWNVQEYGTIQNANEKPIDEKLLPELVKLMNLKVSTRYAQLFNLPELSFESAIKEFGYRNSIDTILADVVKSSTLPRKSVEDYKLLLTRWGRAYLNGEAKIGDISAYLNSVELI